MRSIHKLLVLALLLTACTTGPKTAPPDQPPAAQPKPVPATLTVAYRYGDSWRQVTPLESHVLAGPAEIRLAFSKPVRKDEVEQALQESQSAPVRGVLQWADDKTLFWRVAQMPPRVDFLLGEAHDQDGLPLPGGVPSLRVGEQPVLMEIDVAKLAETRLTPLPADILSAALSTDRTALNLKVWSPGASRWDWQTTDLHLVLDALVFKPGLVEGFQPRLPANLESWSLSPGGNLVAGLRLGAKQGERDLVLADVLGARQQVTASFVRRSGNNGNAGVAWSPGGERIAALTDSTAGADLVIMTVADRSVSTAARDLPVQAGTARLAWSADGRFLLAGTALVDLEKGTQTHLPGDAASARGAWEPGRPRLLYGGKEWENLTLVDALTGESRPLGAGFAVDWAGPGRAYVVRWTAAATRYRPPGQ